MASAKAALKAAKAALDKNAFAEAEKQARIVLEDDASNYFAQLFFGRAVEKQEKLDDAAKAYDAATKLKPGDELAWKGLCGVYEAQGSENVTKHTDVSLHLAVIYQQQDSLEKCQTTIDALVAFAKEHGSRAQIKDALKAYLPTSPVYDFLEGRIQHPAVTFERLAEIIEVDEKERINKEVGQRRTRLGAKLAQVQLDVKREVYRDSDLESIYHEIISWTNDDGQRRKYEEKLLQHTYHHMVVLLSDDKVIKRRQVQEIAHGMVIIKHPYQLAWDIELEWHDVDDVAALDRNVLLEYIMFFPSQGLSKVLQAYLEQRPILRKSSESPDEVARTEYAAINAEEALLLVDEGIADAQGSAFAHRLVADFYLRNQEYESCVDVCRKARVLLQAEGERCGLCFENSIDATSCCLGTSLVYYQTPKNHPEAKKIFDDLLKRRPTLTPALLGIGLVYEQQEDYDRASAFLEQALSRNPGNIRIAVEAAWCNALTGKLEAGCAGLSDCLSKLDSDKHSSRDLKSQASYRVGRCLWDLHDDKATRKDRNGPYSYFIMAIRANPSYAPAYTSLGIYYGDYAKDRKRARQCFQKAFELSASEILAAEQLARAFARDVDWDIVEAIAQRAIDSGAVKPLPGSKRKAVSWPFAALGTVQMNRRDFPAAVQSYQSALRVSPQDYHSWVGLGESYLSSGRYNAASKTLEHARHISETKDEDLDSWFASYIYANVLRELGDYDDSIQGYREILRNRPNDGGVSIALLQSLVEHAVDSNTKGLFKVAAQSASHAILLAAQSQGEVTRAVNFWKAVGDACMVLASVPSSLAHSLLETLETLFNIPTQQHQKMWSELVSLDNIDVADAGASTVPNASNAGTFQALLQYGLIAQKFAVVVATHDMHARAVAWYNLGWTEHRVSRTDRNTTFASSSSNSFSACATAAVKCFKRAIELEAGNADFWDGLGVVTATLNPKISQHSFARSLHLNERSARTWTNLGTLHLTIEDYELAHEAFSRAQSTDPDYVDAWVGEGLVALNLGDDEEARSHFEHAFDISSSSDTAAKKRYLSASYSAISACSIDQTSEALISPIFASQQLLGQLIDHLSPQHLLSLLLERAGDCESAIAHLIALASGIEAQYESSESDDVLSIFIRIKSDLARLQLGAGQLDSAKDNASTALDLSEGTDQTEHHAETLQMARLSAHLTSGMASYFLGNSSDAVASFRLALQETHEDIDIVCLLAEVLWAKRGSNEKTVAREQLFDVLEKEPRNMRAMTTLGAIAAVEGDSEVYEAVESDLRSLRTNPELSVHQRQQIDELLVHTTSILKSEDSAFGEAQRSIMTDPAQSSGWASLHLLKSHQSSAQVQLTVGKGNSSAELVAGALTDIGTVQTAQEATMLCPWVEDTWKIMSVAAAH